MLKRMEKTEEATWKNVLIFISLQYRSIQCRSERSIQYRSKAKGPGKY